MTQSNTFNYKAKKKKTQLFVLNFASLWQDIACWIVPSKDLYMDKPEIIRDLMVLLRSLKIKRALSELRIS
ncbi:hypothetical protein CS009_11650 [Streptococcus macedonicus]|uniref:Uncharacterized protein n=1 Tax=Streptococcus macedonicus TaxID=59310 RepID=A0AAP8KBG6_STRMC|nr:hypothetical protein CS009_11650 [Streptococcus macedonicus]